MIGRADHSHSFNSVIAGSSYFSEAHTCNNNQQELTDKLQKRHRKSNVELVEIVKTTHIYIWHGEGCGFKGLHSKL